MAAQRLLSARELFDLNDDDLQSYLEAHVTSTSIDLVARDPENLIPIPGHFRQRLLDASSRIEQKRSDPVDSADLLARLLQVQSETASPIVHNGAAQSDRQSSQDTDVEALRQDALQREGKAYNELLRLRGRPIFALNSLEQRLIDADDGRHVLSFFYETKNPDFIFVFSAQLDRWRQFRKFQDFVRAEKHDLKSTVELFGMQRQWADFFRRKPKNESLFVLYKRVMTEYIEQLGYSNILILVKDVQKQGPLSTWYEYLGFEMKEFDRLRPTKRERDLVDVELTTLLDAKVLRSDETEESIQSFESIMRRRHELERMRNRIDGAMPVAIESQDQGSTVRDSRERERMMDQLGQQRDESERGARNQRRSSRSRSLDSQESSLSSIFREYEELKRRNDAITRYIVKTHDARERIRDINHRQLLIDWIVQEIHTVIQEVHLVNDSESELDKSELDDAAKFISFGSPGRKRSRPDAQSELDSDKTYYFRTKRQCPDRLGMAPSDTRRKLATPKSKPTTSEGNKQVGKSKTTSSKRRPAALNGSEKDTRSISRSRKYTKSKGQKAEPSRTKKESRSRTKLVPPAKHRKGIPNTAKKTGKPPTPAPSTSTKSTPRKASSEMAAKARSDANKAAKQAEERAARAAARERKHKG